jgi:hypothetical protein
MIRPNLTLFEVQKIMLAASTKFYSDLVQRDKEEGFQTGLPWEVGGGYGRS